MPLPELARFVAGLGFTAVELPVRPGFQVEPENVARDLPEAARVLGEHGVRIASVAGPTDQATIEACAAVGVPVIRICVGVPRDRPYLEHEAAVRREFEALVPLLDRAGVRVGIQNHSGRDFTSAAAVRRLLDGFDPRHLAAVWDAAHCALAGEQPDLAADILWSHLCMVNLKNGLWQRSNGPEAEVAEWRHYWTSGRQGLASWPRVVSELRRRAYSGPVCLTAEYSNGSDVDRLIAEDIGFARSLFA